VRGQGFWRFVIAVGIAVLLHALVWQFLLSVPTRHVQNDEAEIISVKILEIPQIAENPQPEVKSDKSVPAIPILKPTLKPIPDTIVAPLPPLQTPDILTSKQPVTPTDIGKTVSIGDNPEAPPPESRAAEEAVTESLRALAENLSCLSGFSEDCADIRKEVFKDFQMTETDKVWTKKYAHTGLPVEFYGLSERQVRAKLNLHFAGENGIYIPFTNIGIDGAWWDALHGIKKGCEWKIAISRDGNGHGAIKDCPKYLPAAKEDRDRRNKYQRDTP